MSDIVAIAREAAKAMEAAADDISRLRGSNACLQIEIGQVRNQVRNELDINVYLRNELSYTRMLNRKMVEESETLHAQLAMLRNEREVLANLAADLSEQVTELTAQLENNPKRGE